MNDVAKFLLIGLLGLLATSAMTRSWSATERRLALLAVPARLGAAVAQELIYRFYYGYGDMFAYQYHGERIANAISIDFWFGLEAAVDLFFQQEHGLPFFVFGQGNSTGTTAALAGLYTYFISSELYVMGAINGVLSGLGMVCTYTFLRDAVSTELRPRVAAALFLLPSVVFWSSAMLKEAVIMGPLGLSTLGLRWVVRERRIVSGGLAVVVGAVVVFLIKPYVLVGMVMATGPYVLAVLRAREGRELRVNVRVVGLFGTAAIAMLAVFGQINDDYDIDQLGERIAAQQEASLESEGGSNVAVVDASERSLVGQLAFLPATLPMVAFRPFLFEARNPVLAANALESTFVLFLCVGLIRRFGIMALFRATFATPEGVFLTVYSVSLAVGIGLTSTNLGTLSRYRIPMYAHFLVVLLLAAAVLARRAAEAAASTPEKPTGPRQRIALPSTPKAAT